MARICAICNADEVTSSNPDVDFCRICHYTGRAHERTYAVLLGRLSVIDGVVGDPAVWHTGGGCFNLAVRLTNGLFLTPSVAVEDDHGIWPEPGLPLAEKGEKWAVVVSRTEESWAEWIEEDLVLVQATYTDDELVAAVEKVCSLSFEDVQAGKLGESA